MKKPTVSVVIPIYNTAKFLPRCLDSVLNQSFQDFEIIAVNDESPDNADKILAQYAKRHPSIKIITQKNGGLAAAKNTGLGHARGEFVYFLDSDDFIHPQLFEITVGLARRHNADMITFVWDKKLEKWNGKNPESFPQFKKYESIDEIPILISDDPIARISKPRYQFAMYFKNWTRLIKRDLIDCTPHISGIIMCEDLMRTAFMLGANPRIRTVFTRENLAFYSEFQQSITNARFTVRHIASCRAAYDVVYGAFDKTRNAAHKNKFTSCFFNDARTMYKRIQRQPVEDRAQLMAHFSQWLLDMDSRGWLRLGKLSVTRVLWLWRFKRLAARAAAS